MSHILLLSVLSGVCMVTFSVVVAPLIIGFDWPSSLTMLLGFLILGMPLELGVLLFEGHKRNGNSSLREVVLYRAHMPLWTYDVILLPYVM